MKKLYVSLTDRKIFGICGGIGETYDFDPKAVRLIVFFLTIATGVAPGVLTYLLAWLTLPLRPQN
jgi:phage shock protein C